MPVTEVTVPDPVPHGEAVVVISPPVPVACRQSPEVRAPVVTCESPSLIDAPEAIVLPTAPIGTKTEVNEKEVAADTLVFTNPEALFVPSLIVIGTPLTKVTGVVVVTVTAVSREGITKDAAVNAAQGAEVVKSPPTPA